MKMTAKDKHSSLFFSERQWQKSFITSAPYVRNCRLEEIGQVVYDQKITKITVFYRV